MSKERKTVQADFSRNDTWAQCHDCGGEAKGHIEDEKFICEKGHERNVSPKKSDDDGK